MTAGMQNTLEIDITPSRDENIVDMLLYTSSPNTNANNSNLKSRDNLYARMRQPLIARASQHIPVLCVSMCEHAFVPDFKWDKKAYIKAVLENVDWAAVEKALFSSSSLNTEKSKNVQSHEFYFAE